MEGAILVNENIYGANKSSIVQMSYAAYQALTDEEKNDGTARFIPDYPAFAMSGIDYSLEEQATGRHWIDGKMIYQKSIAKPNMPDYSGLNWNQTDIDVTGIDKVTNAKLVSIGSNQFVNLNTKIDSNKMYIMPIWNGTLTLTNSYINLEYTKQEEE